MTRKKNKKYLDGDKDAIASYVIWDFYGYYKDYTSIDIKKHSINYRLYQKIIREANKVIIDEIINTGKDFVIPFILGKIVARKYKVNVNYLRAIKRKNIDLHKETKGYLPIIKYFTEGSDRKLLCNYYKVVVKKDILEDMRNKFKFKRTDYFIGK